MEHSGGKLESMVLVWRPSLHHRGFGHGGGHDTWSRLSLLWSCAKKVRSEYDLGLHELFLHHHVSMVFLGVFVGILSPGHERIHR